MSVYVQVHIQVQARVQVHGGQVTVTSGDFSNVVCFNDDDSSDDCSSDDCSSDDDSSDDCSSDDCSSDDCSSDECSSDDYFIATDPTVFEQCTGPELREFRFGESNAHHPIFRIEPFRNVTRADAQADIHRLLNAHDQRWQQLYPGADMVRFKSMILLDAYREFAQRLIDGDFTEQHRISWFGMIAWAAEQPMFSPDEKRVIEKLWL